MTDSRDTTQRHNDENRNAADDMETAEEDAAQDAATEGDDPNDFDADNAVEADSIETLDPDNPPA